MLFLASQLDSNQNFGKLCYLCGNGMVRGRGVNGVARTLPLTLTLPLSCSIYLIPSSPSSTF